MSGFDFDALRDPVAPEPGARERARVEARARELRARNRRARIVVSATSLVAVVAIVVSVVALTRNSGPTVTVEGSSTTLPPVTTPDTYGPSIQSRFIPPTTTEHGNVVLPVTLPDGKTFTMEYAPAMKIARLGFEGGINVGGRQVMLMYTTQQHVYAGAPIAVLPAANGSYVSLYDARQRSGYVGNSTAELAFQFGHWLAYVDASVASIPEGRAELETYAKNLTGTVDPNGYLVLHARAPLAVGDAFEGGFGKVPGNALELASHLYCGQPESDTSTRRHDTNGDGSRFVSWCDGALHVTAEGSPTFLDLAGKLQVSPLTASTDATPTTTTTRPPASGPLASGFTASFVSPRDGWALGTTGQVEATNDGGSTWHAVGAIGNIPDAAASGFLMRFADATHGFVFTTDPNGSRPLEATVDGGVRWTKVTTPFSHISDLAIFRGTIYVVATPSPAPAAGGFPGFRIFSKPVLGATWSTGPLVISPGAGPIPYQQLVFAGNQGWMLNVDRLVGTGARLDPGSDHWTPWAPICSGVGGPASLTASTSTDLVAVCDPGVTSTSSRTVIEFSHDGGKTFTKTTLPGAKYGAQSDPLSPSAHVAFVINDTGLQRTTDDGATWHEVARFDATGGATDSGFTSPTQGFITFGDGTMYMTYDAGLTWKKVNLP